MSDTPRPNLQSETDFPTEVLQAELNRREEERKRACQDKLAAHHDLVCENIDALLLLVPEHSRTSCSDTNSINSNRCRCTRCVLLESKRAGHFVEPNGCIRITAEPTDPDRYQPFP